jgi:hypothetical protein
LTMPQPLSRVVPPPQDITMHRDVASRQPELAALVAQAISVWSLVEYTIGCTLVDILGAKASPAIAMYSAINSSNVQMAAIRAAAEYALTAQYFEYFEALMKLYGTHAKQRHKFAHWIWAYCEKAPDHLVLVDPINFIHTHTMLAEIRHNQVVIGETSKFEFHGSDEWYCYSKDELQQINSTFSEVLNLCRWFQTLVGPMGYPPKDKILELLNTHSLLVEPLSRLRASHQNAESKPE